MDIVNNEKELEITRKDKEATENDSNKAETTNISSFRIISIINTASTEEGEKDTKLEDDITEATDSGAVTGDSMLTNDPSKRPLAPNTKNTEDNNDDSNPQVEHYHKDTGKANNVPKKNVPVDDAITKSIYLPEDKNNDSEPEVDTVASTIGNGNTLNAKLSLSYNSPCDMVDTTDEKSVTYSIPQAEHHHNNKEQA